MVRGRARAKKYHHLLETCQTSFPSSNDTSKKMVLNMPQIKVVGRKRRVMMAIVFIDVLSRYVVAAISCVAMWNARPIRSVVRSE
jgi:hypothetical protein